MAALNEEPLFLHNAEYPAELHRVLMGMLWHEGIVPFQPGFESFKVTQRAGGANMSVDVGPGRAVVPDGTSGALERRYGVLEAAKLNEPVTAGPGADSRIDLVVLRVNDEQAGGPPTNNATVEVIAGTPGSAPSPPPVPASALGLATVGPITSATSAITDAMITDVRQVAGRVAPVGTIDHVTGPTPTGWTDLDGGELSRTADAALYALLGDRFGAGDGSTTFNKPNLQSNMPVGSGVVPATVEGDVGGATAVALSVADLPTHVATIPPHNHPSQPHQHTSAEHSHPHPHEHANVHHHTQGAHAHPVDHSHPMPHTHPNSHAHGDTFAVSSDGEHSHAPSNFDQFVTQAPAGGGPGSVVTQDPPSFGATNVPSTSTTGAHSHPLTGGVSNHNGSTGEPSVPTTSSYIGSTSAVDPGDTNNYTGNTGAATAGSTQPTTPGPTGLESAVIDNSAVLTSDPIGAGEAHENMPPYQVCGRYIIKR